MPSGVPAGLLALAGSGQLGQVGGGRQPGFQSALTGSLGLLSQAQQGQGQRGDRQFDQMLQIAEMEQQIRQAEAEQAQAAQQRAVQQAYIQSLPEGQQAQAAAFPKIFAGEQAKARFREPRAPAQVDTVRMSDGTVRSFRRDDPALDQALKQGGVRFNAQVTSPDIAGLGGATAATQTRAQQTLDTAQDTLGIIQQFRETLRPENIGISGNIRELGIGALGQAESFQAWAGTQIQSIIDQAIQSGDTMDLSKFVGDPDLSSQRLLENILAYRLAKIQDPNGRISDKDFANARLSLGMGKKLGSIGDLLARLDSFEKTVERTQGIALKRLGIDAGQAGGLAEGPDLSSAVAQRQKALGVSQEDLEFTAQQNGLTVEQVLDQLEAR